MFHSSNFVRHSNTLKGHSYSLLINTDWGNYNINTSCFTVPQFKTSNNNKNKQTKQNQNNNKITLYSLTSFPDFGRLTSFLHLLFRSHLYTAQFPLFKKNVDKKSWVQQRFKAVREREEERARRERARENWVRWAYLAWKMFQGETNSSPLLLERLPREQSESDGWQKGERQWSFIQIQVGRDGK